jgi:hypothetical protein
VEPSLLWVVALFVPYLIANILLPEEFCGWH